MSCSVVARLAALCLLSLCCCPGRAQVVDRIDSVNLSPGRKADLKIYGKQLTDAVCLWTPFGTFTASEVESKTKDTLVKSNVVVPAGRAPGCYEVRILTPAGLSDARFVLVDDLPSFTDTKSSDDKSMPTVLPTACCVGGHLEPLKSKFFQFSLGKEESVSFEVYARRLDSMLDPVMTLRDAAGNEVGFADDTLGMSGDAFLRFEPPRDGDYTLELRDVEYSGGPAHFFHLRVGQMPQVQGVFPRRTSSGQLSFVAEGQADVLSSVEFEHSQSELVRQVVLASIDGSGLGSVEWIERAAILETEPNNEMSDATDIEGQRYVAGRMQSAGDIDWYRITSDRKQHLCVTAHTRELGSPADVVLELYDSKGKKLQQVDDIQLMDAQISTLLAKPGDYFFSVRELTEGAGSIWTYDLEVELGGRLELSADVEHLSVPAGGAAVVPIAVKRHGIAEPVELEFKGLPSGLRSSPVIVQPNQNTAFVTIRLTEQPLQAPLNRIFLVGKRSSGNEVPTRFRPAPEKVPKQKLLRPQAGMFASQRPAAQFSVASAADSLKLPIGGQAKVSLHVKRSSGWTHPIRVESAIAKAELPLGISITTTRIESDAGELILTADRAASAGRYSISLSCTSQKDKTTIVQPVPTITIDVE